MSTVGYDGQSLLVDGRRVWLVSGAIHYPRTPHELWRKRIRAAKEAGLNCIETYCFWNAHEPRPGQFDFTGDLDLRRFVQTVAEEGMWCIVRPGPYVCAEWDFGGLPAWLHRIPGIALRQSHPAFLEACSRYLAAVMGQIADLQVTSPRISPTERANHGNAPGQAAGGYQGQGGGPIILMQAENEWFSHNPEQHDKYLVEVVRYLRENGCTVPLNNCNNLWQTIDGTIDTWNGARNLAVDMRQLATVHPEAPRFVTEYWPGWFDEWGKEHSRVDSQLHLYRMAGILGTGAMFNLYMFHGGTNFAFWGGRTVASPGCFMTTSYDYDAPLLEAGGRGEKYALTKRISTFASHFGNVFAELTPDTSRVAVVPDESTHTLSILHTSGTQGDAVFLLRGAGDKARETRLLLPNGLALPVDLGEDRAAWLLLNAPLGGGATLDYTNLRPFAFLGRRLLVLFGPAGSEGIVSVDGGQFHLRVPSRGSAMPMVEKHGEITVVVLNEEQVDSAYPFAGGLAVGAAGLDDAGEPIAAPRRELVIVALTGDTTKRRTAAPVRKLPEPAFAAWEYADLDDIVAGRDEGFRAIDGPESLERLDADYGYGWYKFRLAKPKSGKVWAPESADRLHVYAGGTLKALLGFAPGANPEPADLSAGGEVVVLADNLGRFNYGQQVGEEKGLFGHVYSVKPIKLGKPKIVAERAADPFDVTGYVYHRRRGDRPMSRSLTWEIKTVGKQPVVVELTGGAKATLLLNSEPFAVYLGDTSARQQRWVLTPGVKGFTAGKNRLTLSLLSPEAEFDAAKHLKVYQTTATLSDGPWAFRPWSAPGSEAFAKLPRTLPSRPAWFRGEFTVREASVPLWFEPRGMTKGQVFLNGRNVGRYFVATRDKKRVPPQARYYLPEPWLKTDGPNELLVFDEHGASPVKSALVYDAMGPYNG